MSRRRRRDPPWLLACDVSGDPACEYNYAVVTIYPEHLRRICRQMAWAKQLQADDRNFYALSYFDYQVECFSDLDPFEPENGEWLWLPSGWQPKEDDERWQRLCGETIKICPDRFYWQFHPKHGDGTFETTAIYLDDLRNWFGRHCISRPLHNLLTSEGQH